MVVMFVFFASAVWWKETAKIVFNTYEKDKFGSYFYPRKKNGN